MTKLSDTLTNVLGEIPPIQTPHSHKLKGELFRILSDNLPLFGTVIPQRLLLPSDQLLFCFGFITPVLMLTMR